MILEKVKADGEEHIWRWRREVNDFKTRAYPENGYRVKSAWAARDVLRAMQWLCKERKMKSLTGRAAHKMQLWRVTEGLKKEGATRGEARAKNEPAFLPFWVQPSRELRISSRRIIIFASSITILRVHHATTTIWTNDGWCGSGIDFSSQAVEWDTFLGNVLSCSYVSNRYSSVTTTLLTLQEAQWHLN